MPSKKAYGSFPFRRSQHLQELLRQNGGDEQAVAAFGDDGLEQCPIGRLVVAIELVDQQLGPIRFEIPFGTAYARQAERPVAGVLLGPGQYGVESIRLIQG